MGLSKYYKLLISKKRNGIIFTVKYLCVRVYFKIALAASILLEAPISIVNNSITTLIKTVFALYVTYKTMQLILSCA